MAQPKEIDTFEDLEAALDHDMKMLHEVLTMLHQEAATVERMYAETAMNMYILCEPYLEAQEYFKAESKRLEDIELRKLCQLDESDEDIEV